MNKDITVEVNHEVLIWARESLALSRNQTTESTGITFKKLVQIESGEKFPTLDELKKLSKLYKRTIATLLLSKPPKEKPLPTDRRTIDSKFLGSFHEKTIMAIRKARALGQSYVDLKRELNIRISENNFSAIIEDNPKLKAFQIRKELKLDEIRPIENINYALDAYIERVESLSIAVFQLSLTEDEVRGFTILDEEIPIIGIKRKDVVTAKIFTLFHELGHVLLNKDGISDLAAVPNAEIEKWCNAFSAEILIPTTELLSLDLVIQQKKHNTKFWTKKDLIQIGNQFHVGPLAVLRSLLENKLTTQDFYKEKHEAWNKPSFGRSKSPEGRNLARETIKEKGRTYISLAFSAFDQNRIDLKDLSDFLGIKLSSIPKTRQLMNS